jgi:hypothetical protein
LRVSGVTIVMQQLLLQVLIVRRCVSGCDALINFRPSRDSPDRNKQRRDESVIWVASSQAI